MSIRGAPGSREKPSPSPTEIKAAPKKAHPYPDPAKRPHPVHSPRNATASRAVKIGAVFTSRLVDSALTVISP